MLILISNERVGAGSRRGAVLDTVGAGSRASDNKPPIRGDAAKGAVVALWLAPMGPDVNVWSTPVPPSGSASVRILGVSDRSGLMSSPERPG